MKKSVIFLKVDGDISDFLADIKVMIRLRVL